MTSLVIIKGQGFPNETRRKKKIVLIDEKLWPLLFGMYMLTISVPLLLLLCSKNKLHSSYWLGFHAQLPASFFYCGLQSYQINLPDIFHFIWKRKEKKIRIKRTIQQNIHHHVMPLAHKTLMGHFIMSSILWLRPYCKFRYFFRLYIIAGIYTSCISILVIFFFCFYILWVVFFFFFLYICSISMIWLCAKWTLNVGNIYT